VPIAAINKPKVIIKELFEVTPQYRKGKLSQVMITDQTKPLLLSFSLKISMILNKLLNTLFTLIFYL
jgi:hypothetical protein